LRSDSSDKKWQLFAKFDLLVYKDYSGKDRIEGKANSLAFGTCHAARSNNNRERNHEVTKESKAGGERKF